MHLAETLFALALLGASPADSGEDEETLHIAGFVDLYAAYNANRPFDHGNFFPGAGVVAKRDGEIELNLAAIEVRRDPAPVGFHLILGAGNEMDVLHLGEPAGEGVGRDVFENVYRASVSYAAAPALLVEAGIYPSHIGFESALARDTWNYTGSWAGNFSPYYQTGVKAVWSWGGGWSGGLHVVNGWQIIADNNDAKSLGAQLGWSGARGGVAVNGWAGPELPGDDSSLRTLLDVVATAKATAALDLALEVDFGRQELPGSPTAEWTALAGWARWTFNPKTSAALRLERFDDPDAGITGLPQRLEEATLTFDLRPHEQVIVKLEGRYDRSTAAVFTGEVAGAPEREQFLLALGTIFTF